MTALALILLMGSASASNAQDYSSKEGFAGCTGTSPFIETLISKTDPDVRPLMKIGEMQAWAIKDQEGNPATALTTQDGLTIVGRIIGPQGEDITAALLATVPDPNAKPIAGPSQRLIPPSPQALTNQPSAHAAPVQNEPITSPRMTLMPGAEQTASRVSNAQSPALNQLRTVLQPQANTPAATPTPAAPAEQSTTTDTVASAPITAIEQPSAGVQAGMDTIFKQAGEERIWFSAATPNPGAPVVYMLADPECPHCQWTIDAMHNEIASGAIDLRIIPAPITGVQGFNTSLSILHSENIPQTFMAHMTSKTRGTAAVIQMDANQADKAVIQGIVDNINWMRTNKMPGVPFFLYQTDQGAQFAFSELPSDILTVAKADASVPASNQ
ncbi:hypothetical protein [uncultured Roseobacter sp.]|uniref:hypothetical protein n=1 Tax=uncultured Roseobacter sp. TaxID=114847 RepID=UPI00262419DC|nr:hypothetical protein [uncultured Roseobacter sp.]